MFSPKLLRWGGDIMTKTQHWDRMVRERIAHFRLTCRKSNGALWNELQRTGKDQA